MKVLTSDDYGLANYIALKYTKKYPWLKDEIESAANWGLVKSAIVYKEIFKGKSIKFSTFIYAVINSTIKKSLRQYGLYIGTHDTHTNSHPSFKKINSNINVYKKTGLIAKETIYPKYEIHEVLDKVETRLNHREKKIVKGHFLLSKTLKEVGKEMGISIQRTQKIKDVAINKLSKVYAK